LEGQFSSETSRGRKRNQGEPSYPGSLEKADNRR